MANKFYTSEDVELDYYYQLPKILVNGDKYKDLKSDDLIGYCLLQDRHKISKKNSWIDEKGRIFFYFKHTDFAAAIGKSPKTAQRIKKHLIDHELLYVEYQGHSRPSRIYLLKPDTSEDEPDWSEMTSPDWSNETSPDWSTLSTPLSKNELSNNELNNNKNLSVYPGENERPIKDDPEAMIRQEIEQSELPIPVKKPMLTNIKRMVQDALSVADVSVVYQCYKNSISDSRIGSVLHDALSQTKGTIRNIKKLLEKCLLNYQKETEADVSDDAAYSGETLDLFAEIMGA